MILYKNIIFWVNFLGILQNWEIIGKVLAQPFLIIFIMSSHSNSQYFSDMMDLESGSNFFLLQKNVYFHRDASESINICTCIKKISSLLYTLGLVLILFHIFFKKKNDCTSLHNYESDCA